MEVLVFKTNVRKREQVFKVGELLKPVSAIFEWSFDLEDRDRILRVITRNLHPKFIESLLQTSGIYCRELED